MEEKSQFSISFLSIINVVLHIYSEERQKYELLVQAFYSSQNYQVIKISINQYGLQLSPSLDSWKLKQYEILTIHEDP